MIIDSLQYNGECSCGKSHFMQTEFCLISSGCLKDIDKYLEKYNLKGYTVAVYDKNTYLATSDRHPNVDKEIILDPTDLHANEKGVEYLKSNLPQNVDVLIAIGAGTIHDITRYCAYTLNVDFVSCPTAASVDGFCSSVAAMTWNGCKKTLTAVAPKIVIADIEIIKNAPIRLTRSGFGDMIGKFISLTDWKIGNILTGEYYCERIANMTYNATEVVLDSVDGILNGKDEAYEKLIYGLLLSGLAMQMIGNSRPASGAEHHVSHLIEMSPPSLNISSTALHGEKVGVGTLIILNEYKRLSKLTNIKFIDYTPCSKNTIISIFGSNMSIDILKENENDSAKSINANNLSKNWDAICKEINKIPEFDLMIKSYTAFNVKSTLEDIEVSYENIENIKTYSPLVRNRLTLMRIRKCITQ